jgi:hypothetical protein
VSWWLCPPEEFAAKRAQEQPRMAASKFGHWSSLTQGPDMHLWRPTRQQKQTLGEDWWG